MPSVSNVHRKLRFVAEAAPAGNAILAPVPPLTQAQVELFGTSVIARVFQFVPLADHSKVKLRFIVFRAAHKTVILV